MKKLLIIILILSSCQSYRAERKIKKLKEWGYLSTDTITKYDTLRGFTLDSIYFFDTTTLLDTITRIENGLKVSTVIKWKTREIRQVITQRDTILEHKYTTKVIKEKRKWWDNFGIGAVSMWILFIILLFIKHK